MSCQYDCCNGQGFPYCVPTLLVQLLPTPERFGASFPVCTSIRDNLPCPLPWQPADKLHGLFLLANRSLEKGMPKWTKPLGKCGDAKRQSPCGVTDLAGLPVFLLWYVLQFWLSRTSKQLRPCGWHFPLPTMSSGPTDLCCQATINCQNLRLRWMEWNLCSNQEAAHIRYWRPHRLNSRQAQKQVSAQHIQKPQQTCLHVLFNSSRWVSISSYGSLQRPSSRLTAKATVRAAIRPFLPSSSPSNFSALRDPKINFKWFFSGRNQTHLALFDKMGGHRRLRCWE